MRIKHEQLSQHLKRGLKPLYLLTGDEPLLIAEAADTLRNAASHAGYNEREVMVVEAGFDWRRLKANTANLSLFGTKRLVEIRIPSGKPGTQGGQALQDYCAAPPPDTLTLVILPKLDRQTQAAKWCKTLLDSADSIFASALTPDELGPWLVKRLALQNQQVDAETLHLFLDLVEGNLLAAHQEVQKLGLIYPAGNLTAAQVKDAVLDVARYDVFKLIDAVLVGQNDRAQKMLSGLREEGSEALFILAMLVKELRLLIKIKAQLAAGRAFSEACRATGVWESKMALINSAADRVSLPALQSALSDAAKVDKIVKGVHAGDAWEELSRLVLKLTRRHGVAEGIRGGRRVTGALPTKAG